MADGAPAAGTSRRLDTPVVTVDGRPLPTELYPRLRLVRVEESVQLPDAFTLRFEDPHFELFDEARFTFGTRVEIAFRAEQDPLVVTAGEVTTVTVEPSPSGRHELVVGGLDAMHRLLRGPRTRTFQQMSDAAIARQIAAEYGLDARVGGNGPTHPYVLQAGQSDGAFLRERAARLGFDVWVTGRELHFEPHPRADGTPPVLTWGENLLSFRTRFASSERCDEVVVTGWDAVGGRSVTGRATEGDAGTDAPAAADFATAAQSAFGRVVRRTGRQGVATAEEAEALARSLLLRTSGSEVLLQGEATGDPRLTAGATVRLQRVGSRLAGGYRLTSVEHVAAAGSPYVTRFTSGAKDPAALVDLLSAGAGGTSPSASGAAAPGGGRVGAGVVVGQVTNVADPENLARVKVTFPTLSTDDESTWARVASPGAGAGRGLQWLPEVGDEVLVGFEYGAVHRPVVLGGLWSRQSPPPLPDAAATGATDRRTMTSRAGSVLELVDSDPAEVLLRLGDTTCRLHLTEAESTLGGDRRLVLQAQEIEVRADRTLRLAGDQVEITADATLTLSGRQIRLN